jgi:Fe2+ transport system protein B
MHIFIDESGIHKSTGHSVIVLVYIETKDLEALEETIIKAEEKLHIEYFHWSATVLKVKENFLKSILKEDFTIKIAVFSNPIHIQRELEQSLQHMIVEKNIYRIVIDGKQPKLYSQRIKKVLRDKGITVKKLRTANDEQVPALRLADAIAGLIRSHLDDKTKFEAIYKQIEKKIVLNINEL